MKTKRLFAFTIVLLLFANSVFIWMPRVTAQQLDTIAISPTSGPPGTVVTLSIIAGDGWAACYAGDVPLGPVSSSVTYTIPQNVEVGRQMKFFCDNGINVTRKIFSNIVWFTITAPLDSDGDTVPDSQDVCPNDPGAVQWQGCPDADGDGLPTQNDQCPYEYGPVENAGCPIPPTEKPPFTVPTDGPCAIATFGVVVNVRRGPSLDEDVVGSLYPEQLYYVIGQTQREDGTWWQIDAGWVAGFAVQYGGYCASIPETGPVVAPTDTDGDGLPDNQDQCPQQPGPASNNGCPVPADTDGDGLPDNQDQCPLEAGPVSNNGCPEQTVALAPSQVDLNAALAECPQLVLDAQALPIHIQLNIAYGQRLEPTCDYVQRLLAELVFGSSGPALSDENAQAIMDQCPEVLPALVGMMDRLRGINAHAWQILDSVMTPENACQLARAIASGQIPPEFGNALMGNARVPLSGNILLNYSPKPAYALASDDLIDTAIATCIVAPISLDRAVVIRERMKAGGVQDTQLFVAPCLIVSFFAKFGDLSSAQQIFFDRLQDECGMSNVTAYLFAELAELVGVDWAALLALDGPTLCADVAGAVAGNLKDPTTDPNVAPSMLACYPVAYHLQGYESELSLYELWVILSAPNPCNLAVKFINLGALDFADQTHPLPTCFDIPANTVTLDGGFVLTGDTDWSTKLAVLSRPPANICGEIMLTYVPDRDEDGLDDETDLCPEEFALTTNGCPGGVAPNTAPEIGAILDQALMQGTSIDIGVTVSDADGDSLTLDAISGDPTIVSVMLTGNILTVTGVNIGTTTVDVSAFDGTDTTTVSFNATVNAPAPNTPPAINPIPNQTITTGQSLNVLLAVSDADGDPLTLTAAPDNPTIATAIVAGTTLTITGLNAGSTPVTVIVADGSTTSSTTFNVDVLFAAPPAATPSGPGPAPSDAGGTEAIMADAEAAGLTDGLEEYGLLELPGEFVVPSAAFQATAGEGQPVNIFVVSGGQLSQPLGPSAESHSFPTLDPTGELLAFLTTDTVGVVTLRVLNVPNNVSLPILGASANWTVGPYPPAWSPDGDSLVVTLVNNVGVPGIYEVDLSDPTNAQPTLLIDNAATASYAPNGDYIAFEHIDPQGNSSIYVFAVANPNAAHPITNQPAGSSCYTPMFGADSVSLFFICDTNGQPTLYRYGVQGLTALDVGVVGVANPVPGPGVGFMGFDDGAVIYYGYDDGSRVVPMLRLQGQNANHIRWTTLADLEE